VLGKTFAAQMNLVHTALDHRLIRAAAVTLGLAGSLWRWRGRGSGGLVAEPAGLHVETNGGGECSESEDCQSGREHRLIRIVTKSSGQEAEADEDNETSADNQPHSGFLRHRGFI